MNCTHIRPRIFEDFCCIADECPANCCSIGWSITWTAQEVDRLYKAASEPLRSRISTSFIGDEYKTLKLNSDGECPFLNEGLCSVQQIMGEQYLSYTCRQYPRISRLCGEVMISSCRPTCYAVMDRLYSDSGCMQLNKNILDKPIQAIITAENEIQQRLSIFEKVSRLLWNNDIHSALKAAAAEYDVQYPDNIQQQFRRRYGWDIIVSDAEDVPQFALRNIITALFLEWIITRYDSGASQSDNVSQFLFKAQAVILGANGAAALCTDRTQLLCSICDLISAL